MNHPAAVSPLADRRTSSPLARTLFQWAVEQDAAVQLLLFRESARVLGVALSEDQAHAILCVRACGEDIRLAPTRDRYRLWFRAAKPDVAIELLSAWQIEQLFGGRWSRVLSALAGEVVSPALDLRASIMGAQGPAFTADDLAASLRLWRKAEPDVAPQFDRYRAWATGEMETHGVDVCHYAISINTFISRFGSWFGALRQAGVAQDLSPTEIRALSAARKGLDEQTLLDALRDAARWADGHGRRLTRARYDEWRETVVRDAVTACSGALPPEGGAFARHFGSLPRAMALAGVITEEEALARILRRGVTMNIDEVRAWIWLAAREVADALGTDFGAISDADYARWRDATQRRLLRCVPAPLTIVRRFERKTFGEATLAALSVKPTFDLRLAP